jgi:hypothetical protein
MKPQATKNILNYITALQYCNILASTNNNKTDTLRLYTEAKKMHDRSLSSHVFVKEMSRKPDLN